MRGSFPDCQAPHTYYMYCICVYHTCNFWYLEIDIDSLNTYATCSANIISLGVYIVYIYVHSTVSGIMSMYMHVYVWSPLYVHTVGDQLEC